MEIKILQLEKARLRCGWFFHGGKPLKVMAGAWNFYVPDLEIKLAYPRDGALHCLRRSTPDYARLMAGAFDGQRLGRYSAEDWKRALNKSTRQRAVENYLAASRLHDAGLGPKPLGLCHVRDFSCRLFGGWSETAGIIISDIRKLPPKADATEEQIIAAGVTIDAIRSCLRQQINGYVSDLNSVVGVMPVDADRQIEALLGYFSEQITKNS